MNPIEQTQERTDWLVGLEPGHEVQLETLLGLHVGRVMKIHDGKITVKIIRDSDPDIGGFEVKIHQKNGIGVHPHNRILPVPPTVESDSMPVLEHIGGSPPPVVWNPLGWEAA